MIKFKCPIGCIIHMILILFEQNIIHINIQNDVSWCMLCANDIFSVDETKKVNPKLRIWGEKLESKGFKISKNKK